MEAVLRLVRAELNHIRWPVRFGLGAQRVGQTNVVEHDIRGCCQNLGLGYAAIPSLSRYSSGLSEPREILIRFSLYQRMYMSST